MHFRPTDENSGRGIRIVLPQTVFERKLTIGLDVDEIACKVGIVLTALSPALSPSHDI